MKSEQKQKNNPLCNKGYLDLADHDISFRENRDHMQIERLNRQYVELMRKADNAISRQEAIELINRASVLAQQISAIEKGADHSVAA